MEDLTEEQIKLWSETLKWIYKERQGDKILCLIKDEAPARCKEFYKKYLGKK